MALKKSELSVNDLAEQIGEEQSNVSHHLKNLVSCNVVFVRQDGKKRIYSLNKEVINPILQIIDKHVKTHCTDCTHCKSDKTFDYTVKIK